MSDPIHDSYFVHSIMRALDQVDALKSHLPILGSVIPGDFAEARKAALPAGISPVETVTSDLVGYLQGMTIFGHPHTQQNVIPPPTIPSLIGVLLSALHNPNVAWDEYSRLVAQAEVEAAGITARLVGYDPEQASGVFTFGGTGTSLYGVKIGLEKACPQAMHKGVSEDAVLLVSEAGHYCAANIAGWLGIGADNLIAVPTTAENEIDLAELGLAARKALTEGKKVAAIIATLGTTDAFGLDDLQEIAALRDSLVEEFQLSYSPHIHADAVIGWAWSVFNDYDFEGNPLGFRPRTVRALAGARRRIRHLSLADSLGVDFHKTGFAPYVSSLVLVKNRGRPAAGDAATRSRCPTSITSATTAPACTPSKPREPGPGRCPPWPTSASSESRDCRWCSGTSSRWPSSCASTSKGTRAPPCSTGKTSAR